MRIGIISNIPAPYSTPVFERVASTNDCSVLVVYESSSESNRQWRPSLEVADFDHTILRTRTLDLRRLTTDAYLHLPLENPLSALRTFGAEVVVAGGGGVWSSPANIAALGARRKEGWAFVPYWGSFPRETPSLPRRLADPWVRRFVRSGDGWLAYGTRAAQDVTSLGADPSRTVIASNVPERRYSRPLFIERESRRTTRFLFVGQLIERKGIRDLLDAFGPLEHAELWIVGDGPLAPLVARAAAANKRIRVVGHVDTDGLADLYASADALVLPSVYEVWGLVVHEAMAFGLPVIVTAQVGAADDLVEPGVTGVVVPPRRPLVLRAAMKEFAGWSRERRVKCAERAGEVVCAWSIESAAAGILKACEIALEHRRLCA